MPLVFLAHGRDAVRAQLEGATFDDIQTPGAWMLLRDDAGRLILVVGGHVFTGSGTAQLSGSTLRFDDGRIVAIQPPPPASG